MPGQGHGEGLDGNGVEVKNARVQIDGGKGPAGDHHSLKFLEHWPHRQTGVQAAQLHSHHATSVRTDCVNALQGCTSHSSRLGSV